MRSCKKLRLTGNTFAPKTKFMCSRGREKENRIPGLKVGRSSSLGHQLRATTSVVSKEIPVRNAQGQGKGGFSSVPL